MTFVGKVLVIVQVVLAMCFMTFAAAVFVSQQNWKQAYDDQVTRAEDIDKQLRETETQLQTANNEKKQVETKLTNDLDAVRTERDLLKTEKQTWQADLKAAETERDNQQDQALLAKEEAAFRRDDAIKQREINEKLHKSLDDLHTKYRDLDDEKFAVDRQLEEVEKQFRNSQLEIAKLKAAVAQAEIAGVSSGSDSSGSAEPAPEVNGVVEATQKIRASGRELVEISIGSDDGLRKGHTMVVFRPQGGGRYLGKIKLIHTEADKSVGEVVERAKNGTIIRGDIVTTRL